MLSFRRKCINSLPKTLPGYIPSGRAQECPRLHTLQVSVLVSRGGCSFLLPLHCSSQCLICKMGWLTAHCFVSRAQHGRAWGELVQVGAVTVSFHLLLTFSCSEEGFCPTSPHCLSLPESACHLQGQRGGYCLFCELSAWGQRMYFV